ncbi:MAG: DUF2341 domain-containing protein [Kiritimatiellae bacterium]|nr:DUF2341 domain-containing protein [Kiritimatiellia bacterium]
MSALHQIMRSDKRVYRADSATAARVLGVIIAVCGTGKADDWYGAWGYRQKITISASQVSGEGALTNFPALIAGDCVQPGLWEHALTNGADIAFTTADGVTVLSHEIEQYDAVSSQLCAWVRIPVCSSASNTSIYMYYGKADAAGAQDPTNVWADYRAVWHLSETSGTFIASTSNRMSATPSGGIGYNAAGLVAGAASFDGTNGYLTAGRTVNGNGTISLWVWFPSNDGVSREIFNATYNSGVLLRRAYGYRAEVYVRSSGSPQVTDDAYFANSAQQWIYMTLTLNGGEARLYRNGAFCTNFTYSGTPSYSATYLGQGLVSYWSGRMDEVRSAAAIRSDAWIATEYNNQNAPASFATTAAEEIKPLRSAATWYRDGRGTLCYRQRIVIDGSKISGVDALTNFPVLITQDNVTSGLWSNAQANGGDILFTGADGTSRLSFEIERYSASDRQIFAWVRLPELTSGSSAYLYMYYGRYDAGTQQDPTNLWSDYRAVWHLSETSGTFYASTSNRMAATPTGAIGYNEAGRSAGAASFDGSSGYLTAGQTVSSNGTISLWIWYPSNDGLHHEIFNAAYNPGILIRRAYGTRCELYVKNASATIVNDDYFAGSMTGQWVYVAATLNDGVVRLYRNGAFRAEGGYSGVPAYAATYLGQGIGGYWSGRMDEVRSTAAVRSDAWIATEYNNVSAPALFAASYGEEPVLRMGTAVIIR